MSILADKQIASRCKGDETDSLIWPHPTGRALQPASVDLALADEFLVPRGGVLDAVDLNDIKGTVKPDIPVTVKDHGYALGSGELVLGSTVEWVNIPKDLVGSVEGKSSLARLGLFIHVTAGFIDPGFSGTITLELFNGSRRTIILRPGLAICQIAFSKLGAIPRRTYGDPTLGSKYQNQEHTTGSKYQG